MGYSLLIQPASSTPKYRQIVEGIVRGIRSREIGEHERLPSINEFSAAYDVSRDTVEKAYRQLKSQGVVISVPGKGYFTSPCAYPQMKNVLLLFNKVSAYKRAILEGFIDVVGDQVNIDFQFYYDDFKLFEKILKEKAGKYSDYVIIPSFKWSEEACASRMINELLPLDKVWILNSQLGGLQGLAGAVYQDYEHDIQGALDQARSLLSRYQRLILVFPTYSNYSRGIIRGFQRFAIDSGAEWKVIYKDIEEHEIVRDTAYVTILDHDLVALVKKMRQKNWEAGRDIGILAYNDSPLKEVLLDGITVMSTDHHEMGATIARMILENDRSHKENTFNLIVRNSL